MDLHLLFVVYSFWILIMHGGDVFSVEAKHLKTSETNGTYMWHYHLGHIGKKRMQNLHSDGILLSFNFQSFDKCEACLMGKMTKKPFNGYVEWASVLLEIIHSDVYGPMSIPTRDGYLHFVTFVFFYPGL
jgi:hypothetical protein